MHIDCIKDGTMHHTRKEKLQCENEWPRECRNLKRGVVGPITCVTCGRRRLQCE
jgi:hypothetical protein